jgi:hypothetical protein
MLTIMQGTFETPLLLINYLKNKVVYKNNIVPETFRTQEHQLLQQYEQSDGKLQHILIIKAFRVTEFSLSQNF